MSDVPCMSCGGNRREAPVVNQHGHCLHPSNHITPQKGQAWVLLHDEDHEWFEIKGTGLVL